MKHGPVEEGRPLLRRTGVEGARTLEDFGGLAPHSTSSKDTSLGRCASRRQAPTVLYAGVWAPFPPHQGRRAGTAETGVCPVFSRVRRGQRGSAARLFPPPRAAGPLRFRPDPGPHSKDLGPRTHGPHQTLIRAHYPSWLKPPYGLDKDRPSAVCAGALLGTTICLKPGASIPPSLGGPAFLLASPRPAKERSLM